ncbi:hypothetical protein DSECCO2_655110 [anaerobic digester metagenome]
MLQLRGLRRQLLRSGGDFLGRGRVLLDHLVELLQGLVDLACALALLLAGGVDFLDEVGRALDVRHEPFKQLPGLFRDVRGGGGEVGDFRGRSLAALGELAHLACDHGETAPVLTGPGGLHGGIEGQQVRLPGYLLDDGDLAGDGLHGGHGLDHGLTRGLGVLGGLDGDGFGLFGVVSGLADARGHFLHGRRGFLDGRGLFGGSLGQG